MGYREVELAGLYGRSAAEFRTALDTAGLTAPAGHVGVAALTDNLVQTIADAKTLGHRYLILPWVDEEYRTLSGWRRLAELLNRAGERLHAAGLAAGLPQSRLRVRARSRRPRVLRLRRAAAAHRAKAGDVRAGPVLDPEGRRRRAPVFQGTPGRFRAVHVKDMAPDGTMVDLGQGVMDWTTLLREAPRRASSTSSPSTTRRRTSLPSREPARSTCAPCASSRVRHMPRFSPTRFPPASSTSPRMPASGCRLRSSRRGPEATRARPRRASCWHPAPSAASWSPPTPPVSPGSPPSGR